MAKYNDVNLHVSRAPFRSLRQVRIRELDQGIPSYDRFVLLKTLYQGCLYQGKWTVTVIDDTDCQCEFVWHHFPEKMIISAHTYFILKEPYYRFTRRRMYGIKCECPTDVILFRPSNPLNTYFRELEWDRTLITIDHFHGVVPLKKAHDYAETAFELCQAGNFFSALDCYVLGWRLSRREDEIWNSLQCLIMSTYFLLNEYENAITVGMRILNDFKYHVDTMMLVGRCYYNLRQYNDALKYYQKANEYGDKNNEVLQEMELTQQRLEQKDGNINIEAIERFALQKPFISIDHAEFRANVIKGYGFKNYPFEPTLICAKNVTAGTILLVTKALCFVITNGGVAGCLNDDENLITKAIQLVYKNPNKYAKIFSEMYEDMQGLGTPAKRFCDPETNEEYICDADKIRYVISVGFTGLYDAATGTRIGSAVFRLPTFLKKINPGPKNSNAAPTSSKAASTSAKTTSTYQPINLCSYRTGARTAFTNVKAAPMSAKSAIIRLKARLKSAIAAAKRAIPEPSSTEDASTSAEDASTSAEDGSTSTNVECSSAEGAKDLLKKAKAKSKKARAKANKKARAENIDTEEKSVEAELPCAEATCISTSVKDAEATIAEDEKVLSKIAKAKAKRARAKANKKARSKNVDSEPTSVEAGSSDVKDESLDVKGELPDVNDGSPDVKDESLDVKDESLDVKDESLDVKDESLDVKDESLDVKDESLDVKDESLDVNDVSTGMKDGRPSEEGAKVLSKSAKARARKKTRKAKNVDAVSTSAAQTERVCVEAGTTSANDGCPSEKAKARKKFTNADEFFARMLNLAKSSGNARWLEAVATETDDTDKDTTDTDSTEIDSTDTDDTDTDSTDTDDTESDDTEAVATEAVATESVATEAVATEAVATESVATESVATESVATESVATESVATESVATESVATEAVATEAVATEAVATEAVATEAVATEAVATEAVATEAVATKADAPQINAVVIKFNDILIVRSICPIQFGEEIVVERFT